MAAFFRRLGLGAAVALVVLAGMVLLPHDRYVRWQAVTVEAYARLGWIYERIHFDPTPIDVAFVGTSHTMNGVDTVALQRMLAADGRCLHLVNFAVPSYGRNLHWLVVRELLENRKVGTLVLEVFENETRKAHPLFASVADVRDILDAPKLININYVHDLVRLPWRQLSLWAKSLDPQAFGLKRRFDAADYDGSDVDNTRVVNVDGQALTPVRDQVMDPVTLKAAARRLMAAKRLHMLGRRFERYEYAVPDTYVDDILALARRKGVRVVFLYLPGYGKPAAPADERLYLGQGPMLEANDVLAHPEFWHDPDHLNMQGAARFTARLARLLPPVLGIRPGPLPVAERTCEPGFAPRPVLKAWAPPPVPRSNLVASQGGF